jgi:ATP-binding cassette subfamily F protein 3
MLQINNLSLQYGEKHLFKDVSARLNEQDHVGLVGVNGTGKSTILKMMVGIIETDFGVITKSKKATIGYLPQEIEGLSPERTLLQEAETSFEHLLKMQRDLDKINEQLGQVDPQSSFFAEILHQQGELQHQLDGSDFFHIEAKIEKILNGLGFKKADMNKPCKDFSGGWQMRIMLAKLLLTHPSFIFLDEPTNHLDIESLTWLEEFLKSYKGGMIIISHDRSFLDNLTNTTWELSLGKLNIYKGNYSKYLVDKETRLEVQRAAYNNQQAKIEQTMRFVTRFRAKSTKAKQVQGRLKQLSHMEMLELEDSEQKISFRFPPATPSGRLAILADNLGKEFEGKSVFNKLNLEVNRGDKVAVVGVNGAGKSTLVKMLAGLLQPSQGKIRQGHNVKISYFGQHQAQELSKKLTVLQTMEHTDVEQTVTSTRSILGAFLFRGDDVDKKVMVLSGGEKSRLALAKMIITPANLLVMDEPTNHLDMMSQDILQEGLKQYDGSIIVVSHNRFFLDGFINKVLEIKDGQATMYEGNLKYYLSKIKQAEEKNTGKVRGSKPQQQNHAHEQNNNQAKGGSKGNTKKTSKEIRKDKAKRRAAIGGQLKPLKKQLANLEKDIENFEKTKKELEQILSDPELYNNQDAFAEKNKEYQKINEQLTGVYPKWEEVQEKIDKIEAECD